MSFYADDVMLCRIIRSKVDLLPFKHIWTDENCLNFNAIKCKYMVISRGRQPTLPSLPIAIKDTPLIRVALY